MSNDKNTHDTRGSSGAPSADWHGALCCALTSGLMLSCLIRAVRLLCQWWQYDRVEFNEDIRFSLIFWFFLGQSSVPSPGGRYSVHSRSQNHAVSGPWTLKLQRGEQSSVHSLKK